ncbi:MAG: prephenate dehydrogenase/arogenate dehydrogenase family protein [Micromonosporaceae bacterium]|nr:prephenate dehydrogenase/arogenate dehydrogenase family protein [Micromonosporaceae bacterium]
MRIAVIGLGLIGGSVLLALAETGHEVVGYDADPFTREAATSAAAVSPRDARWRVAHSATEAVVQAELVMVAVPLPAVAVVFDLLSDTGYQGLVTDVTSVKQSVCRLAADRLAGTGATFIAGHPMTGRETSGFASADSALFAGCAWVLCLGPDTPMDAWLSIAALVTSLGARVVPATAAGHDRAVAAVSHVPHLAAAAIAASTNGDPLALALAAGSFRDGTRVAATRPELVAAMCGGNAAAVDEALASVIEQLMAARVILSEDDPVADLPAWFTPGHVARAAWQVSQIDRPPPAITLPATPEALLPLGAAGGWVTAVSDDRQTVTAARPDQA